MARIISLDLGFLGLNSTISSFLILSSEGPILVETGPHSTISTLERLLAENGVGVGDVRHVFLTHIHLDHAGAAWYFAKLGAKIYVHPLGVKHLAEPQKLMESARRIYLEKMDYLWGQMNPIDPAQLMAVDDYGLIQIGDLALKALHTPGHAVHHIAWQLDDVIFTGDVAGVKIGNGPVVAPCPPPDINLKDWKNSIEKIRNSSAKKLYLTHFGEVENINQHLDDLDGGLNIWAEWIRRAMERETPTEEMTIEFEKFVSTELKETGLNDHEISQYEAANPAWMSVAGLMRYWTKQGK